MKLTFTFCLILIVSITVTKAQTLDTVRKASPLTFSGFADLYYSYDFNKPDGHNKPSFLFSHNRHNEFALNNALISIRYAEGKTRAAVGFHTGTYVMNNYAEEPTLFQFIYEANAGYEIAPSLWLDAGIFSSHIGFESALSIDNYTLTRSLMAENSPYFETGAKLTFEPSDKLSVTGLVLNGWQNIVENNENKALGTQIQVKPNSILLLNSSSFFGKETPTYDTLPSTRFFHDFFAQITVNKIDVIAAFDIGFQKNRLTGGTDIWYAPNLILRYSLSDKMALAGRVEYFNDEFGVINSKESPNGFKTFSSSVNFDYHFTPNFAWRTEARLFQSRDRVFIKDDKATDKNANVITSLSIKF